MLFTSRPSIDKALSGFTKSIAMLRAVGEKAEAEEDRVRKDIQEQRERADALQTESVKAFRIAGRISSFLEVA